MTEDDLEKIYGTVFQEAMKLSLQYQPQKIAATYMAIACRIYKTVLKDEDYLAMMKVINDTPIEPYNHPTLH